MPLGLLRGSQRWLSPPVPGQQVRVSRPTRDRAVTRRQPGEPARDRRLLDEKVFRDALRRERSRTERFEESFQFVTVSSGGETADGTGWLRVADILTRAKCETDLLGWVANSSVLGLILIDAKSTAPSRARAIARRLQKDLSAAT